MNRKLPVAAMLLLMAALLTLSACRRGNDTAAEPLQIRTPVPTFTPTSQAAQSAETAAQPAPVALTADSAAGATAAEAAAPQQAEAIAPKAATPAGIGGPVVEQPEGGIPPVAVINTELVNSRTGPDTTYAIATVLGRGEDFDITGKTGDGGWLRICCLVDLREVWVAAEFVDSDGPMDNLPVAQAGETSSLALARQGGAARTTAAAPQPAAVVQPAAAPAPAVVEAAPAAAQAAEAAPADPPAADEVAVAAAESAPAGEPSSGGFELSGQETFPETNVVRVFAYVYADNQGLEGYTLRVTKDGAEQSVAGVSFGGQPGMTWPIAGDRQRFQNLKIEFPGVTPAGAWRVELMRDGAVVGPAATFTLAENDPARELYVRYKQN